MKHPAVEALRIKQLEYHRSHPWRLSAGGLFVPHAYHNMAPESLSYWDDVGFIHNGRRIMVWWRHPRNVYSPEVEDQARKVVGVGPRDNWLTEGGTPNFKKVGRSRKKLVSTTLRSPSPEQRAHYDLLNSTITQLNSEGIDHTVQVSWTWKRLYWAMGISLVAPLEVRNEGELAQVAQLAKRLIQWETTLDHEFPSYQYGRSDWLREHSQHVASGNPCHSVA